MSDKKSIGTILKYERLQQGKSLEDISKQTKIQLNYLIAIEDDKLEELPSSFYVRAFIKQYAHVLSINDIDELISDINLPINNLEQATLDDDGITRGGKDLSIEKVSIYEKFSKTGKIILTIIILIFIWVGISYFSSVKFTGSNSDNEHINITESTPKKKTDTETHKPKSKSSEKKNVKPIISEDVDLNKLTTTIVIKPNKTNKVYLEANEKGASWVNISTNTGQNLINGILYANTNNTYMIPDNTKFIKIHLAYAQYVTAKVNGEPINMHLPTNVSQWNLIIKFEEN